MLKENFMTSVRKYTTDAILIEMMWAEIDKKYSASNRHYHTLRHLESMLVDLLPYRENFSDWDVVTFALMYHDIVYNSLRNDNEEKSAELAITRLKGIGFPETSIGRCSTLILATKKHQDADGEINLFTDADLSILGSDATTYHLYTEQIRREYAMYPDILYKPGRRKVLTHFLEMPRIYKTEAFSKKYELHARRNLQQELSALKS